MSGVDAVYQEYIEALLRGARWECHAVLTDLIESGVSLRSIYVDLFQRSLYEVGDLWERDQISVATEHVASAITESLLPLAHTLLFSGEHRDKTALITCIPGEYHHIGAHMVADYFELGGWHGHTLGANTPPDKLLSTIDELGPDLLGFSVTLTQNLPNLETLLQTVTAVFPDQAIIVGGGAFLRAGPDHRPEDLERRYPRLVYIPDMDRLDALIAA